jgi:O-antigen ligase
MLRLLQYAFVFLIIVEELKDGEHIKKIIFSMSIGIILISIDGVWQVLRRRDFIRGYPPVINIGLVRATASFKDSNLLGIYLSAFAPLVFGLTFYYCKTKERIAFIFASLIVLIGIILTYSRPTLLATYIALFFLGIARKNKAIITAMAIVTLMSPFLLPRTVKNWAKEIGYNPLRFMCNDDRIAVYRNSLNMIRAHPFIGSGTNT